MTPPPGPALRVMIRIGGFLFAYRSYLFPLVFIPLAIIAAPDFPFGGDSVDLAMDVLGILVALAGLSLRSLVVGLVYIKRGGKGGKVYADELVQEGIFAHSRNPLYLGNILLVSGLGLVHGSLWLCLAGIPFIIFAYLCIVAAEEAFLTRKFGSAYDDYCRRVNRFFPSLKGLDTTLRQTQFHWKRVVSKEYGTIFATLAAILFLLDWKLVYRTGLNANIGFIRITGGIFVVLLAAYAIARYFKTKGALKEKRSQA